MTKSELEIRKKIWTELSEFYLDTELDTNDFIRKADIFQKSGLDINSIKEINYYEVAPLLIGNLRSIAGIWEGFDQEWLCNILEIKTRKTRIKPTKILEKINDLVDRFEIDFYTRRHFRKIEKILNEKNQHTTKNWH